MDTISMNSGNSKTFDPHRLSLNISDKTNFKRSNKYVANFSIYYAWKNIKKSNKNNKFKISVPAWIDKFEIPDGSYSVSDIQDYFEYIIKKNETLTDIPRIRIYVNKI